MADAYERKLRPIYDAIDTRNYRAALRLSQIALQKYPTDQLLRALRSYALLNSGKKAEATALCEKVVAETISDQNVLHLVGVVLRAAGKNAAVTAAHEAASAARPRDITLLKALFGAYARDLNYSKQQQVALRLQRLDATHEKQYVWWAITCLVQQAIEAQYGVQPTGMSAEQLLQLAQGMAEKRLATGGAGEGLEAFSLYLRILKMRSRQEEAVAAILGPIGAAFYEAPESWTASAELLAGFGALGPAGEIAKKRWTVRKDDWRAWQLSLDSIQEAHGGGEEAFKEAESLLEGQPPEGAPPAAVRGVSLARVELERRRLMLSSAGGEASTSSSSLPSDSCDGLEDALLACFERTGSMMSCARDLRHFTVRLSRRSQEQLAKRIWKSVGESRSDRWSLADLLMVRKTVAAYQIESDMDLPVLSDTGEALAHAQEIMDVYCKALPLSKGLDEKERGPADELPVVAAAGLIRAFRSAGPEDASPLPLLQALCLLEACQCERKVSAGLRLSAAALYSLLGAPTLASAQLAALEIKHVQHDSVSGHLHLPVLLCALGCNEAGTLLGRMEDLADNHMRDFGETLLLTYTHNNYTKTLEFVNFRHHITQSFERISSTVESYILQISDALRDGYRDLLRLVMEAGAINPGLKEKVWASEGQRQVAFNQDLSVRPDWLAPSPLGPMLAIAGWWEPQSVTDEGSTIRWWLRNAAAVEGNSTYRSQSIRQLRKRIMSLDLLCGMLSHTHTTGNCTGCIVEWRRLLDMEGTDEGNAAFWLAELPNRLEAAAPTELCQQLDSALFGLIGLTEIEGVELSKALTDLLGTAYANVSAHIADILSQSCSSGLPIFGPGWALLANFVQSATWAHAAIRKAAARKVEKRTNKGGKQLAEAQNGLGGSSFFCIKGLQRLLHTAVVQLREALKPMLAANKAEIEILQGLDAARGLWAWEAAFSAPTLLKGLIRDQQVVLKRLDKELLSLATSLSK